MTLSFEEILARELEIMRLTLVEKKSNAAIAKLIGKPRSRVSQIQGKFIRKAANRSLTVEQYYEQRAAQAKD